VVIDCPMHRTVAKDIGPGAVMSTTFTVNRSVDKGAFRILAYAKDSAAITMVFGYYSSPSDIHKRYELEVGPNNVIRQVR